MAGQNHWGTSDCILILKFPFFRLAGTDGEKICLSTYRKPGREKGVGGKLLKQRRLRQKIDVLRVKKGGGDRKIFLRICVNRWQSTEYFFELVRFVHWQAKDFRFGQAKLARVLTGLLCYDDEDFALGLFLCSVEDLGAWECLAAYQ